MYVIDKFSLSNLDFILFSFLGLIEANTTELKYIRFVIKAKYLRNLNELGSRGLPDFEPEIQRGQCTLGYTCIDHRYLKVLQAKLHNKFVIY
jgi:hypothetical protein